MVFLIGLYLFKNIENRSNKFVIDIDKRAARVPVRIAPLININEHPINSKKKYLLSIFLKSAKKLISIAYANEIYMLKSFSFHPINVILPDSELTKENMLLINNKLIINEHVKYSITEIL
tara:strand:- start:737 stop:1096 length:360 start_codon:yes stop_codon:yes gene_type:complete